jgi:hypothetical protein
MQLSWVQAEVAQQGRQAAEQHRLLHQRHLQGVQAEGSAQCHCLGS